ncbi:MAG: bifunctional metallophosphatase/5'-nucleotidase [Bacteroidales bacterium]|nr:bifunctional metallophosphatase/5'-nucleotidase [Bacteroidales bacterium]
MQGCSAKSGEYDIDVCVVTDVHGQYFNLDYDNVQRESSLSKFSSFVASLRNMGKAFVLIDNGDNLQGDNAAYYFNYVDTVSPHIYGRIANRLGFDAIVVGNHDLETSHKVYDRVREQYNMPLLAANALKADGKCYFDEYVTLKRGGLRVTVIGFTNPSVVNWIAKDSYSGIEIRDNDLEFVQGVVDRIVSKEHPDLTIVALHAGSGDGSPSRENNALYLARNLQNVDMVIGGHDHRTLSETTPQGVVYCNPGCKARNVGICSFKLHYEKGRRTSVESEQEMLPIVGFKKDYEFDTAFEEDWFAVAEFSHRRVCTFTGNLVFDEAKDAPSAYMNLLFAVQKSYSGADITFAAPLSSRGTIYAGDVDFNALFKIYPFENQLYTVDMTGRQIKDYLEYSYHHWLSGIKPPFSYDSASDIVYKVHRNNPCGERVEIVSMADGAPFFMDKVYKVAMTSYRAMGGDGLLGEGAGMDVSHPENYVVAKGRQIRDLLYDYLLQAGEYTPTANTNWEFVD